MSDNSKISILISNWLGIKPLLVAIAQQLLMIWVKAKVVPDDLGELGIDSDIPLCYALDLDGISNALILRNVCHKMALPDASGILASHTPELPATVYMRKLRGQLVRRADPRISDQMRAILKAYEGGQVEDVQFVPVSILWGRAPQKEDSIIKLLFSDSWSIAGRLRKLMLILIHGRNMFVKFSQPILLSALYQDQENNKLMERKLSRILRVHFRRVREAAIGPDLSHRRVIVDSILDTAAVRRAIDLEVTQNQTTPEQAQLKARKYANEIAADYSHAFIRVMEAVLRWLWNSLYDGVRHTNLGVVQDAAAGRQVVYVPCHRSHIDYLLLSYVLYTEGLVPPHIAAGINLNLPVVGKFLRRGGAFFLRRSFKGQQLYSAVFDSYLRSNLSKGVSIEYFIEGTRSRTGKLLDPKGGMLAMTIKSYLKDQSLPIIFVPVYFGYERLLEGRSYEKELGGQAKKKESIWGLIKSLGLLRKNFGHVYVNFGVPIHLGSVLDNHSENWALLTQASEERVTKIDRLTRKVVPDLGAAIQVEINRNAAVNPVNLLGLVLQATDNKTIALVDLEAQIGLYVHLLKTLPYSSKVTMDETVIKAPVGKSVVDYGIDFGLLVRHQNAMGDIIELHSTNGRSINYFRNNVKHLLALPSLIACGFMASRTLSQSRLIEFVVAMYSLARGEYFFQWEAQGVDKPITLAITELANLSLLKIVNNGETLSRPGSDTAELTQLALLAHVFFETIERYSMILKLLLNEKSGTLKQADLEANCRAAAEHLSLLDENTDPDYFDARAFRRVMSSLLSSGKVWKNEERCLCYGQELLAMGELLMMVVDVPDRRASLQKISKSPPNETI